MITAALRTLLLQQSAITAILGDRIRVVALDKGETLPAMDIRVSASGKTHQSLGGDKPGFLSYLTLDCYSEDGHGQADALARLLYTPAILGFRGVVDGVAIRGIVAPDAPTQDEETVDPASEIRRFVTTVDLEVSWAFV